MGRAGHSGCTIGLAKCPPGATPCGAEALGLRYHHSPGQERSTVGIFKLDADGVYAVRSQVKLGRSSVNTIEIVSGLKPGDRVILSDMSQWDANDRIKLN